MSQLMEISLENGTCLLLAAVAAVMRVTKVRMEKRILKEG